MLFRPSYLREGPGIAKDAPPKKGMALFCEIFVREFWQLLKLNFLFVLSCIPIVTIGTATAAMTRCTVKMVRDQPNDVWQDFRENFKTEWKRSSVTGALGLLTILGFAAWLFTVRDSLPLVCVAGGLAVLAGLCWVPVWPMITMIDLPLAAALKNAALLGIACLQHSLPALTVGTLLFGLSLWFFPLSLPLVLFVPFGMTSFVTSFAVWGDIERLVVHKTDSK